MMLKRSAFAMLAGAFALTATTLTAMAQTPEKLKVVSTFSILGDIVQNIGGERIDNITLVGPDGDAHVYSPTPTDAKRLAESKIVFTNGLKFEGWINRLIKSSGTKASVIEAAGGVKALDGEDDHAHDHNAEAGHKHDHDHGGIDPHAWQSVANAKIYAENVSKALIAADPGGKATYEANTTAYVARLDALDKEIRDLVKAIPEARRKIITSHDAFRYFESAYGIDFISPQGVSTESEASAKDVAKIIQQIRKDRISAIFVENISDPRLMERVSKETGARIGERVYSDALSGPGGPAGTYIDMMKHNIKAFSAALSS